MTGTLKADGLAAPEGFVLINAGRDVTMSDKSVIDTTNGIIIDSLGTVKLGLLDSDKVLVRAKLDILDNNDTAGTALNVVANELSLVAGGKIGSSDLLNAAASNKQALDLSVGTLAANSTSGIYLQELKVGGALTVGHVDELTATIEVQQVDFRSTVHKVTSTLGLSKQDDLVTTDGPVKLVVDGGTLTITDGANGDGVGVKAGNTGSVLLTALGAGSDVITTASIASDKGPIQIDADDDISLSGKVSTGDVGTIFIDARNQTVGDAAVDGLYVVSGGVASANGDIVLRSAQDIRLDANISAATADIGIFAKRDITQKADVLAQGSSLQNQGDVLITAGGKLDMQATKVTRAERSILIQTGSDQLLSELRAVNVSLDAVGSILDNNGADVNVVGTNLRMVAGGSIGEANTLVLPANANAKAIDTQVTTIAAQSKDGIYVEEQAPGADLTVGHVNAVTVDLSVDQVNFRSDTTLQPFSTTNAALDDLTTTAGPIKVVVQGGSLTVTDGTDGDGVGVSAPNDILLASRTGNVQVDARVESQGNHINVHAAQKVIVNDVLHAKGSGSIYSSGTNIEIRAQVLTDDGNITLVATNDLLTTAAVNANGVGVGQGRLAVLAGQDITQQSNWTATDSVLVDAGRDLTMKSGTSTVATNEIMALTGRDLNLALLKVNEATGLVHIESVRHIVDNNDDALAGTLNIISRDLSLRSGGKIGDSDVFNAVTLNKAAIDTQVAQVAAQAVDALYLEEVTSGGSLTVDTVKAATVSVDVQEVNFNSTRTGVNATRTVAELEDLTTTGSGVIKLVVDAGSLTLSAGKTAGAVSAGGSGDVLLEVRGATSSISTLADANIQSGTGHITLHADNDITTQGTIQTAGAGSILLLAETQTLGDAVDGLSINKDISSASGDILLLSQQDTRIVATVSSSLGSVSIETQRDFDLTGTLKADGLAAPEGFVLINAGRDVTMSDKSVIDTTNGIIIDSLGTVKLACWTRTRSWSALS